ncbi:SRPBCC family protein [Myceligenerans xiligouense]|uniref:Polyketide cyclase/dehydrase/lipid transport protein n=1 Tax=Myceligenerans xiligouense TaxID=253184 RepID=A0A3N4YLM4_9MICO|nr:SRPBCC family protein [Myceligenerans xiligouense]RPF21999.1 polyketide cyclase/dehydrase/lipid transport protein [Myceligenerans xiligouense]
MSPSYSVSAEVAASPETVWRIISDVEGMPGWTSSMSSVQIVDGPRPPGVGTAVRVEQPGLPLAVWTVDEWDPPRKFGWTSAVPGVRTQAEHVVEQADAGRSRVTLTITQVGPFARVLGMMTRKRTRALVDTELSGLKDRAESGAR